MTAVSWRAGSLWARPFVPQLGSNHLKDRASLQPSLEVCRESAINIAGRAAGKSRTIRALRIVGDLCARRKWPGEVQEVSSMKADLTGTVQRFSRSPAIYRGSDESGWRAGSSAARSLESGLEALCFVQRRISGYPMESRIAWKQARHIVKLDWGATGLTYQSTKSV